MKLKKNYYSLHHKKNVISNLIIFIFLVLAFSSFSFALDVDFYDSYTGQSSDVFDKISWVDTFPPTYFTTLGTLSPVNTPMVYCVNEDRLIDSTYEFCVARNSANRTACSGVTPIFPVLDTSGSNFWYNSDTVDLFVDIGSGGNTFYETTKTKKRGQIQYFCDTGSGCVSCGSTANSASYDYYFIDETFNVCDFDGSDDYEIRGYYDVSSHVLVDSETCATNLVCDSDHDGATSSSPLTKPSHPCKIEEDAPLACSSSNDCWNDVVCDGARFDYGGICDDSLVDLVINEYDDNCGGDGVLVTVDSSDTGNTCQEKGFSGGYRCDETLDDVFYSLESTVYDNVCKGGVGNSCTVNSDCYHALDCINSFCGYGVTAIYSYNVSSNSIYKGDSVSFDNSLSVSSDNDIKYACWSLNSVNIECDGNSTECAIYCSGSSYDNSNWDNGFIYSFNVGGNYETDVTIGSGILYSDTYSETFCVSGDGNYCFSCSDNLLNDDETDIDWGGNCGYPYFIKCNNGIQDNVTNETNIDYGGVCGNCENSDVNSDLSLQLLKESNLITYPFDEDQCENGVAVQSTVITFVLLFSGLLLIPLLLLIIILIILVLIFGTGSIGLLFGLIRRDTKSVVKSIKSLSTNKKEK